MDKFPIQTFPNMFVPSHYLARQAWYLTHTWWQHATADTGSVATVMNTLIPTVNSSNKVKGTKKHPNLPWNVIKRPTWTGSGEVGR